MKYDSNEMRHLKNGNIEYLKFKILEKYDEKIEHIITLRHGGVSDFPCDTLNFRTVGKDKKENIEENLERISKVINLDKDNIHKAKQNHTSNILYIDDSNKKKYKFTKYNKEEYDAYITDKKNIATLVTTADCNPIIIYDSQKNILANVHSGWKGTIKKVYLETLKKMVNEFGCNVSDILFCIGPSIKKCCFSSEENEFKNKFSSIWNDEDKYIYYENNGERFHIDLSYLIKRDVLEFGIKEENLSICDICTMCHSNDFYSFRKATINKDEDYGTFATIAYLK